MPKSKTRTERFDEAFKLLLVIATITMSASFSFYKEIMESKFFLISVGAFAGTVILWVGSTLYGGFREYAGKIMAWWFLMVVFGITFARLYFVLYMLPPLVVSLVTLMSLFLTWPILTYLKSTIGEKTHQGLRIVILSATSFMIIFDMLFSASFILFPLPQ